MNKCMILFCADKFVNQAQMICGGIWNEGEAQDNVYFGPYGFMKLDVPVYWLILVRMGS